MVPPLERSGVSPGQAVCGGWQKGHVQKWGGAWGVPVVAFAFRGRVTDHHSPGSRSGADGCCQVLWRLAGLGILGILHTRLRLKTFGLKPRV